MTVFVVCGQLQETDVDEYTTLEVQLQCDWFYVYCLDKCLDDFTHPTKKELIEIQEQNYEVDLLVNRLYDFDDSSMPTRVLDIQKGLVMTSGLDGNVQHLQRKIQYLLEREKSYCLSLPLSKLHLLLKNMVVACFLMLV